MEIHETGYAWRYIRELYHYQIFYPKAVNHDFLPGASMTLVGLLPPLCDNGGLLVDGGYS